LIHFRFSHGTVTLLGRVPSLAMKEAAINDAQAIPSAKHILNQIRVSPPKVVGDREISQDVRKMFLLDPLLEPDRITENLEAGVLTLSGSVNSGFQRSLAEDDASRIEGVIRIKDYLRIIPG
jgi:osmotically-inducible protein OsmY